MIPRLKLVNVTKRYGSTVANDAISLEVMPGEILSVLGENGAGKSTLMKIIFGSVTPDEGEIYFDGKLIRKDGIFVIPELECLNPENLK